jgi:CrcB protein
MDTGGPSFSGAEARSVVHDDNNGVSEGVWVHDTTRRRHSHFGEQRSRPNSMSSESTAKARSQRASYQEPKTSSWDLSEFPAPPVPALRTHSHGEGSKAARKRAHTNFSRHTSYQGQSGGDSREMQNQNLTENEVPPPVPSNPQGMDLASAERQNQQQPDVERDTMQSPDSGPPYAARRAEDYLQKRPLPSRPSDWLTTLYTIAHLIFFSIIGTLARLGVQWFAFYPGTPIVTPVIWANVGGSFLMGLLSEDRQLFRDEWMTRERLHPEKRNSMKSEGSGELTAAERMKVKKTIPLYVGLAVGFCGSFTSFSSFMRDVFLALSNSLPAPVNHPSTGTVTTSSEVSRNGGYSLLALLAVIIATVALSLGALIVGAHTALALDSVAPRIPSRFTRRLLDPLMVFLGFGCWLGALFLAIWPPDRPGGPSSAGSWANETWRGTVLFPIVFAPTGCLLRYYVSIKLNSLVPSFPLGTFAANMFGTAIEGMCYDIQHVGVGVNGSVGGGIIGCQVLQGVQDGFCGCLTTVSTWVGEINGLRRRSAYLYALASIVGGFCLMVVIMGSVRWSVGWSSPVCDTGYISKI